MTQSGGRGGLKTLFLSNFIISKNVNGGGGCGSEAPQPLPLCGPCLIADVKGLIYRSKKVTRYRS